MASIVLNIPILLMGTLTPQGGGTQMVFDAFTTQVECASRAEQYLATSMDGTIVCVDPAQNGVVYRAEKEKR
jgi:hypothetical protein